MFWVHNLHRIIVWMAVIWVPTGDPGTPLASPPSGATPATWPAAEVEGLVAGPPPGVWSVGVWMCLHRTRADVPWVMAGWGRWASPRPTTDCLMHIQDGLCTRSWQPDLTGHGWCSQWVDWYCLRVGIEGFVEPENREIWRMCFTPWLYPVMCLFTWACSHFWFFGSQPIPDPPWVEVIWEENDEWNGCFCPWSMERVTATCLIMEGWWLQSKPWILDVFQVDSCQTLKNSFIYLWKIEPPHDTINPRWRGNWTFFKILTHPSASETWGTRNHSFCGLHGGTW